MSKTFASEQNEHDHHAHLKGHGKTIALATLGLFAGAILMTWGWNAVAAGLFGAPDAKFVHALAVQAMVAGIALPLTAFRGTYGRKP